MEAGLRGQRSRTGVVDRRGGSVPAAGGTGSGVFVGRRAELELIERELARAMAGDLRLVVVEGDGGIGKSLLLAHAARTVPSSCTVLCCTGEESEREMSWGVVTALLDEIRAARRRRGRPAAKMTPPVPGADPVAVGAGLVARLEEVLAGGPAVVVLDDLHWFDASSAAALLFALRRIAGWPVLVMAAVRSPFPGDLGDGWRRIVESRGRRVRLGGLATGELGALAAGLGRPLSAGGAARLRAHTGGHPLWSAALLHELSAGQLEDPGRPLPVPKDLAGTIRGLHASLGRPARALVAAGSVLGEEFSPTAAAALSAVDDPVPALQQALDVGLLRDATGPDGSPSVGFAHPLVRSAIYRDLGPARRSQLHSAAVRVTSGAEALGHLAAATLGPSEAAAAELEAAGIAEVESGRLALAQVHLDAAVRLSPSGPRRALRVLAAMEAHLWAGEPARARGHLGEAMAQEPGPWLDAVLGALARSEGRFADAYARSLAAWERLRAGATDVPAPLAAKVAVELASLGVLRMAADEAVSFARAAQAQDPSGPVASLAKAIELVGLTLGGNGNEALAAASSTSPPATELHELAARGIVRLWTDDLSGAYDDLSVAVGRVQAGEPLRLLQPLAFLADACFRRCRMPEALAHAELACEMVDAAGRDWDCVVVHTRAGYAAAAMGDIARAEAHAAAIGALAMKVGTSDGALERVRAAAARASGVTLALALVRDDPDTLLQAAKLATALNGPAEPGSFALGPVLAEALAALGRLEEAEAALHPYEQRAAALGRRSALAGTARVRGSILAARGDGEGARRAFRGALDHARDLPLELARSHLAYGRALAASGEETKARAQLGAARDIFSIGGAAGFDELADRALATLGPDRSLDAPGLLTPAEQAVARLASRRLGNPEIAQQLAISRKTVEYHLSHVYAKLGVANRMELAQLAEDAPR